MNAMQLAKRLWTEDDGVLSFEWTLLATVLVVGIVSGLAAARDAMIDELGDVAEAMVALDDTYVLSRPLQLLVDVNGTGPAVEVGTAAGSAFIDVALYQDCARTTAPSGQSVSTDDDS